MSYNATIYRVLISAPSDVSEELNAITETFAAWNTVNAHDRKVFLEPIHWKTHSYPAAGDRPQALLNKQLVQDADAIIAVFWTRFGTPTGEYDSGTAEEIEQFIEAGKPVLVYFSKQPVVPQSVDSVQFGRLLKYRDEIKERVLYVEYATISEFRDSLSRHLSQAVVLQEPQDGTNNQTKAAGGSLSDQKITTFAENLAEVYRRYKADWEAEKQSQPASTDDAKRILLDLAREILSYRAQSEANNIPGLSAVLEQAILIGKQIKNHRMLIDGGRSYNEFWMLGDELLAKAKDACTILDNELEGGMVGD